MNIDIGDRNNASHRDMPSRRLATRANGIIALSKRDEVHDNRQRCWMIDGIQTCVAEWQRRRDVLLAELHDFPVIPPHGGWSLLLDVSPLGFDSAAAAHRLLQIGKIAATPMVNWGSGTSDKYVRFVFANEPVHRLRGIRQRVQQALG